MSKKAMGLHKAHDHGAGMRAKAEAMMPEIMAAGAQSALPQGPGTPQTQGSAGGGMPFKKGGAVKLAAGGVAKQRHEQATKAGAPQSPKAKFRGKPGVGGG